MNSSALLEFSSSGTRRQASHSNAETTIGDDINDGNNVLLYLLVPNLP
jgi:hypothetical protein